MIARMWHGRVPRSKATAYEAYLYETGLPDYHATPGNLGVYLLRRDEGDVTHFTTLTFWESIDAIKAFAGDDYERARYYPEDDDFLLEREPTVVHHQVVDVAAEKPSD
jgi:heme-degrading monooxygenase HmoA